jgi:hypothetical protein
MVRTMAAPVAPTQVFVAGHERETTETFPGSRTGESHFCHGAEIETTPFWPPAVHVDGVSHAIALSRPVGGAGIAFAAVPFRTTVVGGARSAVPPTRTQTPSVGHATALYCTPGGLPATGFQVCPWSSERQMPPPLPTITQSAVGSHATALADLVATVVFTVRPCFLTLRITVAAGSSLGGDHIAPPSVL